MKHVPQGMSNFFRAFYYMKGHEFPGNQNLTPLKPSADRQGGRRTECEDAGVLRDEKGPEHAGHDGCVHAVQEYIANCKWFTQAECDVYGQEYTLSGWTGALHEYRHRRNNAYPPRSPSS